MDFNVESFSNVSYTASAVELLFRMKSFTQKRNTTVHKTQHLISQKELFFLSATLIEPEIVPNRLKESFPFQNLLKVQGV